MPQNKKSRNKTPGSENVSEWEKEARTQDIQDTLLCGVWETSCGISWPGGKIAVAYVEHMLEEIPAQGPGINVRRGKSPPTPTLPLPPHPTELPVCAACDLAG